MAKGKSHGQILAALERDRARELRARLAELRARVASLRVERRTAIANIKGQCRTARTKLRERCHAREANARATGSAAIAQSRAERDATAEARRDAIKRLPRRRGPTIAERMAESDHEVRTNIPEELTGVFDSVRRHIKGNKHRSRTEAFLEWVEANPGEVVALQMRDVDRDVARMVAEQEALEREAFEAAKAKAKRKPPARAKPRARGVVRVAPPPPVIVVEEVPF